MEGNLYTVEDLEKILSLHPKTIRRFIREGRLAGRKIGRTWMVHQDDLRSFAHGELRLPDSEDHTTKHPEAFHREGDGPRMRVSAVIEIHEKDAEESSRISNSLVAMLNCKDPSWGPVRYDLVRDADACKSRFVLYGSPLFIAQTMRFFDVVAHQDEENDS